MAAYSPRRSGGPVLRSTSSAAKFNRHYSVQTPSLHSSSPSLSFYTDRPGSPNRSISMSTKVEKPPAAASAAAQKRACMCSPTTHPGSFRCSLHKSGLANNSVSSAPRTTSCASSGRLNMRRSAMKNSLVRIGTVEGDLVKRALAALIRPSSHQRRRRGEFRPRPSRLSMTSNS